MADWQDYPASPDGRGPTVAGNVKVCRAVASPQLENERDVLVYLPPSYATGDGRYPVIYMHDGQNLFDPTTSFSGEWAVDQTMEAVSEDGLEAIVVGIANMGPERSNEYSPFKDRKHGGGRGDLYLRFITETLKPILDADFRTLPEREHTGIAGSSLGGLISLFGFFRCPETFGFAAALSPSLWFAGRSIFGYVVKRPFVPGTLYLDVGTREGPRALRDVREMRELLLHKGYRLGENFFYVEGRGGHHEEAAWAGRFPKALQKFFEGKASAAA